VQDMLEQENKTIDQSLQNITDRDHKQESEERMIVAGGGATIEEAQYELEKARKINKGAQIYKKRDSYRTVIPNLLTKDEADKLLIKVKADVNPGAYIVRKTKWCESIQTTDKYVVCN